MCGCSEVAKRLLATSLDEWERTFSEVRPRSESLSLVV